MSAPSSPRRLLPGSPPELLVHDAPSSCPYLPDRVSRLPLRLPIRALRRSEFESRLEVGDRRQGLLLYRTACPDCEACEPIRIDVGDFRPNRIQRRVLRRGDQQLRTEVGPLEATARKVALYNEHKRGRGLSCGEEELDIDGYRAFLGESCCESFELRYYLGDQLAAVAVTDRSECALSAVYCYFDPRLSRLSLGTYSILKQIDQCRAWGLRYLYLGLFIADCDSMAYKRRFVPHQRRLGERWVAVER